MFYNKPHFTIFKANIAFNYFKWIKKKCMVAIDYHTIFFHTIEVNGYHRWFGYQHSSKYNILCSKEERKWYMFGTSGGWANNDRIFIFGWTIQEKIQTVLFFSFATGFFVSVKWPYIWQCIVFHEHVYVSWPHFTAAVIYEVSILGSLNASLTDVRWPWPVEESHVACIEVERKSISAQTFLYKSILVLRQGKVEGFKLQCVTHPRLRALYPPKNKGSLRHRWFHKQPLKMMQIINADY